MNAKRKRPILSYHMFTSKQQVAKSRQLKHSRSHVCVRDFDQSISPLSIRPSTYLTFSPSFIIIYPTNSIHLTIVSAWSHVSQLYSKLWRQFSRDSSSCFCKQNKAKQNESTRLGRYLNLFWGVFSVRLVFLSSLQLQTNRQQRHPSNQCQHCLLNGNNKLPSSDWIELDWFGLNPHWLRLFSRCVDANYSPLTGR